MSYWENLVATKPRHPFLLFLTVLVYVVGFSLIVVDYMLGGIR